MKLSVYNEIQKFILEVSQSLLCVTMPCKRHCEKLHNLS